MKKIKVIKAEKPKIKEVKKAKVEKLTEVIDYKVIEPKVLVYGSPTKFKKVIKKEDKEVNGRKYIQVLLIDGTTELCPLEESNKKIFEI